MTHGITDRISQAEARAQETKKLIRDIKRITHRKFTVEEKIRIVLEGFRRDTPIRERGTKEVRLIRKRLLRFAHNDTVGRGAQGDGVLSFLYAPQICYTKRCPL